MRLSALWALLLALVTSGSLFADVSPPPPAKPAVKPAASLAPRAEDWKGKPYGQSFHLGAMTGLGLLGANTGLSLYGTAAIKMLHEGFLDDVNDQAFIEVMLGPVFLQGGTGFSYNAHLRWDFHRNESWTFYATGGFGGLFTGAGLGNVQTFHPRFAVGTFWNLFEFLSFRGELSHEFTGIGIVYLL